MTINWNRSVHSDTLTIVAQPNYNETEVVCIAIVIVGQMSQNEETSDSVNLLIQGGTKMHSNIQLPCIIWLSIGPLSMVMEVEKSRAPPASPGRLHFP